MLRQVHRRGVGSALRHVVIGHAAFGARDGDAHLRGGRGAARGVGRGVGETVRAGLVLRAGVDKGLAVERHGALGRLLGNGEAHLAALAVDGGERAGVGDAAVDTHVDALRDGRARVRRRRRLLPSEDGRGGNAREREQQHRHDERYRAPQKLSVLIGIQNRFLPFSVWYGYSL